MPSWRARAALAVVAGIALATVVGCGDDEGGEEPVEQGFAGLDSCLGDTERVNEVVTLGTVDGEEPSAVGRMIAREATDGLEYTMAGPIDEDGTITERPLLIFEVFELEDERAARRSVEELRRRIGARIERAGAQGPDFDVPDDVRAVGRVAVVYSVASLGSEQPDPALDGLDDEALVELTSCLERAGYPAGPISGT